jgi:V/A-type H+-transporting ATPase subunit E
MQDKLQELTRKLYEEGLSKGRSDADELLAKARAEAVSIVNEARVKAESIVEQARCSAEELRKNTETEIVLASRQTLAELKEQIRRLVTARELTPRVRDAVNDKAFLKEMILQVCQNWEGASQNHAQLEVMLPDGTRRELLDELRKILENALDGEIVVKTDEKVKSGFRVVPRDGGYYISFTEEDFDALFQEYLRPRVAELLFGSGGAEDRNA